MDDIAQHPSWVTTYLLWLYMDQQAEARRQTGQRWLSPSHVSMQSGWNIWKQGMTATFDPTVYSSKQMMQVSLNRGTGSSMGDLFLFFSGRRRPSSLFWSWQSANLTLPILSFWIGKSPAGRMQSAIVSDSDSQIFYRKCFGEISNYLVLYSAVNSEIVVAVSSQIREKLGRVRIEIHVKNVLLFLIGNELLFGLT